MVSLTRIVVSALLAVTTTAASAQTYPSQPIKMIVPFIAGSPNDVVARLLAQQLTTRLGQSVVIDNRPGGGTTIGARGGRCGRAQRLHADVRHIQHRGRAGDVPQSRLRSSQELRSGRQHRVRTLADCDQAIDSGQYGAGIHRLCERIRASSPTATGRVPRRNWSATGSRSAKSVDMTGVPYKGGAQVVTDMLGGRIDFHIGSASTLVSHVKDGSLKGISVWGPNRDPSFPTCPR